MKEPLIMILLLMGLMFVVAFLCRMYSVRFGAVKLSHYEIFDVGSEPEYVTKTTNNLNNLFQLPPIFIGACILSFAIGYVSESLIFNASGFVVSRYFHTLVHITFNKVLARSAVFGCGLYFLVKIWLELGAKI